MRLGVVAGHGESNLVPLTGQASREATLESPEQHAKVIEFPLKVEGHGYVNDHDQPVWSRNTLPLPCPNLLSPRTLP